MWEFRSLYIAIFAPIQPRQPSYTFGVADPSTQGGVINQSPHLRATWPGLIFVPLLRRHRPSHLVSELVGNAQAPNNGRNNGRNNDLGSESLHEDQARSEADH